MALVKVLYDNLGLDATWTMSTSVPTLPASHLASPNRGRAARTTTDAAQWFKADLGSAQAVGAVAFISPNFSQAATITIEANATDAWGAPSFSTTLTPWDYTTELSRVLVKWFTEETYRWWRLSVDDAANTDGYLQVGLIALGPVAAFTLAMQEIAFSRVDLSVTEYAAGTPYTHDLPTYGLLEFAQRFEAASLVFGDLNVALQTLQKQDGVISAFADGPSADAAARATNLYGRFERGARFAWDPQTPDLFSAEGLAFRESR